jgi:hypothetical protein
MWKNKVICHLQKVNNYTKKDLNNSEADEMSNNEIKSTMITTINKIKEDIYKYMNEFK